MNLKPFKIAFYGNAVFFSEESEIIYKTQGLEIFWWSFFLGGVDKYEVVKVFGSDIFFDD